MRRANSKFLPISCDLFRGPIILRQKTITIMMKVKVLENVQNIDMLSVEQWRINYLVPEWYRENRGILIDKILNFVEFFQIKT